jgi:hypothetical protein
MSLMHIHQARAVLSAGSEPNKAPRTEMDWDCLLHLISTLINAHEVTEAQMLIDQGMRELASVHDRDFRKELNERFAIRRANLAHARGDFEAALTYFLPLVDNVAPVPIEGDRAFAFIDLLLDYARALLDKNRRRHRLEPAIENEPRSQHSLLSLALVVAETNTTALFSDLRPHEALRFEFRKATAHCLLGNVDVSESIVDRCILAMAKHGGSSRTLHELRMAAGETLMQLGWNESAIFGYLLPALELANERGARQYARAAAALTHEALLNMAPKYLLDAANMHSSHNEQKLKEKLEQTLAHGPGFFRDPQHDIGWQRDRCRIERSERLWTEIIRLSDDKTDPFYGIDLLHVRSARNAAPTRFCKITERKEILDLIASSRSRPS